MAKLGQIYMSLFASVIIQKIVKQSLLTNHQVRNVSAEALKITELSEHNIRRRHVADHVIIGILLIIRATHNNYP